MHVHKIQSVGKFAKKAVPELIDPGENILPFHCDFCDTSRTTEATSTRKTSQARFFDDISFVVLKAYLWCRAGEKTILLQNSGFIQRPVEREKNTAENSFCIRNSTKFITFKKCTQKTSPCFWGSREKSFFGLFLSFFVFERPYHHFHITKKSETRKTCWH